jgi:CheY-like chemotaxis protein
MASGTLAGRTVVVVDDNEIAREGLAVILRREGYRVVLVADGAQALALVRNGPAPDLVLLDMLTPTLDGWGFLQARRQEPALASVPVVITTALGIASPEWAASLGACGLLRKPIETPDLLGTVRRCCRGVAEEGGP